MQHKIRFAAIDKQKGELVRGEFPYFWLVIRDVCLVPDEEIGRKVKSLLVCERRLETEEEVVACLNEHSVKPWHTVIDSGYDATGVYIFAMRNGINAIKGGTEHDYVHGGGKRIFSVERPLHACLNRSPMFKYLTQNGKRIPDPREPLYWKYSKHGIRDRLYWLRANTIYETPGDVSVDYKKHQEAEERVVREMPNGERVSDWVQLKERNDQFVNECYIAMQIDQSGLIGSHSFNKPKGKT
jgi:hypothetical protein